MKAARQAAVLVLAAGITVGCAYTLPTPLQQEVDSMVEQSEGVYGVVRAVKQQAADGKVDSAALDNVQKKYNELLSAHDDWRAQVQRVISTQIDNYEVEDRYANSVTKLANAANEFEKAADGALGGSAPADVPDWAVESRELMTRAYNERKNKQAAGAIVAALTMKRWDEVS